MTYVTFKPGWKAAPAATKRNSEYHPSVDIVETGEAYALEFDLPGFTKEDIKVAVDEGVLKVSGERKRNVERDERYYRHFERPEGMFNRSFKLPDHVDGESIKATYTHGVLRLELPKKEEAKPRTIEIK